MTMTSTFLPISVLIPAICAATSLVACTVSSFTSLYFAASAIAFFAMAPVQPWSAAGDEKPMVTAAPGASLAPAAAGAAAAPELVAAAAFFLLPVHAVSIAPAPTPAAPIRKRRRSRPSPLVDIQTPSQKRSWRFTWVVQQAGRREVEAVRAVGLGAS